MTVTLQAKSENGANMSTGGALVTFSLSGSGTSAGTIGPVTDNANGTYTATITGTTAGTARDVSATLNGAAVTTARPSLVVTAGPFSASTSTVMASSSSVASGSAATVMLIARDAANNQLTSGGATVVFSLGTGTSGGSLGSTTDNNNGTYTTTFTASTVGTARAIAASFNGTAVTSTLPTIVTTPGPASLAQSTVATSAVSVAKGSTATLTLRARDASSNNLMTGGLTVTFTKGAGSSDGTIGTVSDNADGTYSAIFSATTEGSARTIGATIGGSAVTSTLPTITVVSNVGPPSATTSVVTLSASNIASGSTTTITLQAKDAAGNNRASGGDVVAFALAGTGTSTGTIGSVTDNGDGTYTATLTGVLAGTARGISATLNSASVQTAMPSFTVVPGPASTASSVVAVAAASIASATTTTVTLTVKDAAGNAVAAGGATVAFSLGSGTSAGTFSSVTDNGNGTYTSTFTGTTAGTARTIQATLNSNAITSTPPTITVIPGAISVAKSTVTVSSPGVAVNESVTLTLTARDANDNALTSGGATVAFSKSGGTSNGTIGTVTDNANGTYTAVFTGTTEGTTLTVGATIGGQAVTTPAPTLTVYTKGMTVSTTNLLVNVTQGQTSSPQLLGVFANGGSRVDGLQATINYTSATGCTSTWLSARFDSLSANPVSVVTITANATGMAVRTCQATITISSTTAGVTSKTINVSAVVARSAVAETAVNLVLMGNANSTATQDLTPDPRVLITNGGRGVLTGLHAYVDSSMRTNEVGSTTPDWLTAADLRWEPTLTGADTNSRAAPATLIIKVSVPRTSAKAWLRVSGNGITDIKIPLNVLFNVNPALVTNPRGLVFNAFAGGPGVQQSVLAFNQNRCSGCSFTSFDVVTSSQPAWLSNTMVGLSRGDGTDSAATFTFTANPGTLAADSTYVDTVTVRANSGASTFELPVSLVVERGLVIGESEVTLFAASGTTSVTKDISISNGGSTSISGLSASASGSPGWLSMSFVGGTAVPGTLRLTANPTGLPKGTVLTSTVTVSASSPGGVPNRTFTVTLRVY